MITAEELLKTIYNEGSGAGGDSYNEGDIERILIEFAKLHVEEALKEASDLAIDCGDEELADNILEIYPLENIK